MIAPSVNGSNDANGEPIDSMRITILSTADSAPLAKKTMPDKHSRETHTHDMKRCSFLIRGTKPCKNRSSADSIVCQYHEPSRLAKERELCVLKKRSRLATEDNDLIKERGIDDNEDECDKVIDAKIMSKGEISRISGSQNRMFNPLATPLIDLGCVGLPNDWATVFKNINAPVHLDIGSARGKFLMDLAEMHPSRNFIGIEIRSKLVEEANQLLERANQNRNCRFICANLLSESHRLILEESFKNIVSINRISVLFPDPWIKKKHRARRVVQESMLHCLSNMLCKEGELIIATDVEDVIIDAREKIDVCEELFTSVTTAKEGCSHVTNTGIARNNEPNELINNSSNSSEDAKILDVFVLDEHGYVLSNPFKPLASEREQVCEMSWRRVFRLVYRRK
mmetsp:Transcript_26570/g.25435  ORF Transcript_26570/g.25435 Transcript_26570/m.25435 type:complete len:397 (-) Transcript_26570:241-1431(-)|eukprot:CAMPEP_0119038216 /NCGR_PEP_ID=MMETSP1177-20130426/6967_1 /TAXON_ID=2985 /ORGANISM="Ochromonas sp, Strain CCMP1899" /LENGTH=396 /DNA_ID=CAMNT_0007000461 /DNA_START=71 /DNA_END=1261 /DNA_ORIENTATION=-